MYFLSKHHYLYLTTNVCILFLNYHSIFFFSLRELDLFYLRFLSSLFGFRGFWCCFSQPGVPSTPSFFLLYLPFSSTLSGNGNEVLIYLVSPMEQLTLPSFVFSISQLASTLSGNGNEVLIYLASPMEQLTFAVFCLLYLPLSINSVWEWEWGINLFSQPHGAADFAVFWVLLRPYKVFFLLGFWSSIS
jgi:hypothetical protein